MERRIILNVYDFDHTIYEGDCTIDFWIYCMKKHPGVLLALPVAVLYGGGFILKRCKRERFKEKFFSFVQKVPDIEEEIKIFWDSHIHRIKPFYYNQMNINDLVISASPEFLIAEACSRLNIRYIASKVNPLTGKFEGKNCRGKEKWIRFKHDYPNDTIDLFYSDSYSDRPLAEKAKKAYYVKKMIIKEWK